MKKIIFASIAGSILLTAVLMTLPAGAAAQQEQDVKRGYINVAYTAEKEVSPDTAEISIAVRSEDKKSMQEAARKNKEISDKIYEYLKGAITPSNNDYIKTTNYSARPNYVYINGKRTFDKYEVSNNIIVHTKSIDKIAKMIDQSLKLGATNVDSLNFSLSEKDAQCEALLATATKNVKKRADIVAGAAGTSVAGIKSVDTSCSLNRTGGVHYMRNSLMMAKAAGAMEDSAVAEVEGAPIEAGVIKIFSNVNASFYVK